MGPSTDLSDIIRKCSIHPNLLHAEFKQANPTAESCPFCSIRMSSVKVPSPTVDLTLLPPSPSSSAAKKLPERLTMSERANTYVPALITSGASLYSNRSRDKVSFLTAIDVAMQARTDSIKETTKKTKRLTEQVSLQLYAGDYTVFTVGGLPSRKYTNISMVEKYNAQTLVLDDIYPSHEKFIDALLGEFHVEAERLAKTWHFVAGVTSGHGASITKFKDDMSDIRSLRTMLNFAHSKQEKGPYHLILFTHQEQPNIQSGTKKIKDAQKRTKITHVKQEEEDLTDIEELRKTLKPSAMSGKCKGAIKVEKISEGVEDSKTIIKSELSGNGIKNDGLGTKGKRQSISVIPFEMITRGASRKRSYTNVSAMSQEDSSLQEMDSKAKLIEAEVRENADDDDA